MSYSQDLATLNNPDFEDFLRIAANNIPSSKRAYPWVGLSHGVKLLENDDELAQYLCAYGKMHKEKIFSALDTIKNPTEFFTKELTIIDWGCGQGLATVCFLDYMRNLGIVPQIKKVILIEPSEPAINRAKEHLCKYVDSQKIVLVNKYINDIQEEDIAQSSDLIIHFFSNILDIGSVDINYLADTIKRTIKSEQLMFCVGPQNTGASRISSFAKLFDLEEEDLIEEHSGKLTGRGTINLLVFRLKAEKAEVIKVEYHHRRNLNVDKYSALQRVLRDANTSGSVPEKALQFYRSAIELERKNYTEKSNLYKYQIVFDDENTKSQINIDIQSNPDFEQLFKENLHTRWSKNLSIKIGVIVDSTLYYLLQYIYPSEDIKTIDIENQYIPVELSSFSLNIDVAEGLEIGEDRISAIESVISDSKVSWDSLERILKEAISNDVSLDSCLQLSLSGENPALSQINSELKQLASMNDGDLLNQFLNGNIVDNTAAPYDEDSILQLVPADESQRKAIATALSSKVSVITGPPGTGKTQMILNLIANAFMMGKSVLVASKNNKAVDNIKDRYDIIDDSHYLLRFGTKDAVSKQVVPYLDSIIRVIPQLSYNNLRYAELQNQYKTCCHTIHEAREILRKFNLLEEESKLLPDQIKNKESEKDSIISDYSIDISALSSKHHEVLEMRDTKLDWNKMLVQVKEQINTLQRKYSGLGKLFFDWFSKKKYAESVLNNLLQLPPRFVSIIEDETHITNVDSVKSGQDIITLLNSEKSLIDRILFCISDFERLEREHTKRLNDCANSLSDLESRKAECQRQIELIIDSHSKIIGAIENGRREIEQISVELFKLAVVGKLKEDNACAYIAKYKNYLPDRIPWMDSQKATYINDSILFKNIFRLNAVTNLSIKNSYPLLNGFFDMVVIDEASQCDVASALPLIYRAKQLVVIGDPLQLKHISAVNADEEMAIKEHLSFEENPLVKYAEYSLWDYCRDLINSAKDNNRPVVLDCHYRCHPQIIGYSNRMFYERVLGTTLNVKTREKNPQLKQKGIIWEDVRGVQRSKLTNINDEEVKKCISIAITLANQYPDISIGIISPFKHQAEEINKFIPPELKDNRIVADTVHKFQGDERDVIIYSLVVTDNSPDTKIRWIDRSVPNLVNVAVTRARTTLYIVGNKRYISSHSNKNLPLGNLVDYTETNATVTLIEPTKTYIIDTNIFVLCPDVIDHINPRDNIVISAKVVDELDKLKDQLDDDSKKNVKLALRYLNLNYCKRKIRMECADTNFLPADFSRKRADNLILSIAVKFRNQNAILLTNDNGLQLKSRGLGIDTLTLKEFLN